MDKLPGGKRARSLMLARIGADNDQELAAARDYFKSASETELLRLWMTIQRKHADPLIEQMSLLAQLKFGELVAETRGTG